MRDLATKRDAGTVPTAGRQPTVADWLAYFVDTIAARKVRPRTLQSYRWLVDTHLVPRLGHHRLDRLQPEHVETAYTHMLDSGLAPATVLHAHRVLSRALKVALQRGRVVPACG